jgi:hypothetical protein
MIRTTFNTATSPIPLQTLDDAFAQVPVSFSTVSEISAANTTLTAANTGQLLRFTTASTIVTLPALNALNNGQSIAIANAASNFITVQSAGGAAISALGGTAFTATQFFLQPGDMVVVTQGNGVYLLPFVKMSPQLFVFAAAASSTFTTPFPAKILRVRVTGGGQSGAASGSSGVGASNNGGTSSFGAALISATGGGPGGLPGLGSGGLAGGSINLRGGNPTVPGAATNASGGLGGATVWGGAGLGPLPGNAGNAGQAPGAGGGGAGGAIGISAGQGGLAGGYAEGIIYAPAATYAYTVGAGGAAATAGVGGFAGGAGADGGIVIEVYY